MLIPLDKYPDLPSPARLALTIGVFDGVHAGHQELIRQVILVASREQNTLLPTALTFAPHPATLFAPDSAPLLLGTLDERIALLQSSGIEQVITAVFDAQFAQEDAETFVRRVLVGKLKVGAVVVGEDFHYGRDRLGDAETLRRAGDRHGFTVVAVPQVFVRGIPARSTEIRKRIAAGLVEEAGDVLRRPFSLWGNVVSGRQLGRTIGFPTANLRWDPLVIVPDAGVYGGRAFVGGRVYRAAISVGNNPTVAPDGVTLPRTVEAYLLDDFSEDIYGSEISLTFEHRLRGMEKFNSLEDLVQQMNLDVQEVLRRVA